MTACPPETASFSSALGCFMCRALCRQPQLQFEGLALMLCVIIFKEGQRAALSLRLFVHVPGGSFGGLVSGMMEDGY